MSGMVVNHRKIPAGYRMTEYLGGYRLYFGAVRRERGRSRA
jgi:hypothetical protein